jgi:hypothetical protein
VVRKEKSRPARPPPLHTHTHTHTHPLLSLPPWSPDCLPPDSTDSMIRVGTNYQAVIPECKPGEWQDRR